MADQWFFDDECLIDTCMNPKLIDEIGFPVLRELVIIALRQVQKAPEFAAYVHLIDNELVYLCVIGKGWCQGRPHPALMLPYTLQEHVIEPFTVFKASEVHGESDGDPQDSGPLAPQSMDAAPHGKGSADAPPPETLERRLTRELRDARRRRKIKH